MASPFEVYNFAQRQGEIGRERKNRNLLAGYAGQAFEGGPEQREHAIAESAKIDPNAAYKLRGEMAIDEDRRMRSLYNMARSIKALSDKHPDNPNAPAAFYERQLVPGLRRLGLEVSDKYDPVHVMPVVDQVLAQFDPTTSAEAPTGFREAHAKLVAAGYQPGSDEYKQGMQTIIGTKARPSSAAIQYVKQKGADGREYLVAVDPRGVGAHVLGTGETYGPGVSGAGPQLASQPGGDPFAGLHAAVPGLRVTSQLRTPEENARLPNSAPNSYHLTNQAIDLDRPSPEQRAQIDRWAAQNGYEVIANYADGHVHLEPSGRQGGPGAAQPGRSQNAASAFVGRTPEEEALAVQNAKNQADLDAYRLGTEDVANRERLIAQAREQGKHDVEKRQRQPKARLALQQGTQRLARVEDLVASIKPRIGTWTAGLLGSKLAQTPGTPAHDLASDISTLQAIAGFDELQAMREASPTGGALGNVTVRELEMLQSVIANLQNSQSPAQLSRNIDRFAREVRGAWQRIQDAYDDDFEQTGPASPAPNDVDARRRALLDKY